MLARLDAAGLPMEGWPIAVPDAGPCPNLWSLDDGSARVLCLPPDLNKELNSGVRIYGVDPRGHPSDGWPVELEGLAPQGRVVGNDLVVVVTHPLGDVVEAGTPSHAIELVRISARGDVVRGVNVLSFEHDAEAWAVGPDGTAYGTDFDLGPAEVSRLTAVDRAGVRSGWPLVFEGLAAGPRFGPGGAVAVTVGSIAEDSTWVERFEPDPHGLAIAADVWSGGPEFGDTGGCGLANPHPPIVADDGTVYAINWLDSTIVALDSSLGSIAGWPYRPGSPLEGLGPRSGEAGDCPALTVDPADGPGGALYVALEPRDQRVGGSIVALDHRGSSLAGWPVELRRAGSRFRALAVSPGAMVFALAVEPEADGLPSATVVALKPDSSVVYTATIVDQ